MPEGDTIHRTAETMRRALAGKLVTAFDVCKALQAGIGPAEKVVGRTVVAVEPRGKHMLVLFRSAGGDKDDTVPNNLGLDLREGDLVLHTHLRMNGEWHVYRPGERWWKSAQRSRVAIYTAELVAPCFDAPVIELLTARATVRHPALVSLGPDLMDEGFDVRAATERIIRRRDLEIGVALLDQRALAGVGNVYKSEALFLQRISPFVKVGSIPEATLERLVTECHRLLRMNHKRGKRKTRGSLKEDERLWVYGRGGDPCTECGEPIDSRTQGDDRRVTFFCRCCQSVGGAKAKSQRETRSTGKRAG